MANQKADAIVGAGKPAVPGTPVTDDQNDKHINAMETSLGSVMSNVQQHLKIAPAKPAPGAATPVSIHAAVDAEVMVQVETEWAIAEGLTLYEVVLRTRVYKATGTPATLAVSISATATIAGIAVRVTGEIPHMQQGHDTIITLKIEAASSLTNLQLGDVLADCDKMVGEAGKGSPPTSTGKSLLDAGTDSLLNGTAASMTLTIVKSAKTSQFSFRSFHISISKSTSWQLSSRDTGGPAVKFEKAALSLYIEKNDGNPPLDAGYGGYLQVQGKALVGSTTVEAAGKIVVRDGKVDCLLSCAAAQSSPDAPKAVIDQFVGKDASKNALAKNPLPPEFSNPPKSPSAPQFQLPKPQLQLGAVVSFGWSQNGGWHLNFARVEASSPIHWTPLPNLQVTHFDIILAAWRSHERFEHDDSKIYRALQRLEENDGPKQEVQPAPKAKKADSSSMLYGALLKGEMALGKTPVEVTVSYDGENKDLIVHLDIRPNPASLDSLETVVTSSVVGDFHGQEKYDQKAFSNDVKKAAWPSSCPVDLSFMTQTGVVNDLRCRLKVHDGRVSSLHLSGTFNLHDSSWELFDGLSIAKIGVWIDMERSKEKNQRASFKAALAGELEFKSGLKIHAVAAAIRDKDGGDFLLQLSATKEKKGTGMSLKTLTEQPELKAVLGAKADDISLPPSFPTLIKPQSALESLDAMVSLRFSQVKIGDTPPKKPLDQAASQQISPSQTQNAEPKKPDQVIGARPSPLSDAAKGEHDKPQYSTKLVLARAAVKVEGTWELFDGVVVKGLGLQVLVRPASKDPDVASRTMVQLKGQLTIAKHPVSVVALLDKDGAAHATRFRARIASLDEFDDPQPVNLPLSDVLAEPEFGGNPLEPRELSALPSDLPQKPEVLVKAPNLECEVEVFKDDKSSKWQLSSLHFSMPPIHDWVVIDDLVVIEEASLQLEIISPKATKREVHLSAHAKVRLGAQAALDASIQFDQLPDQSKFLVVKVKVAESKIRQLVNTLKKHEGGDDLIPADAPINPQSKAVLDLELRMALVEDKKARKIQSLTIWLEPNTPWKLEPFELKSLRLSLASIDSVSNLTLNGEILCGSVPLDIAATYDHSKTVDEMNFSISCRDGHPITARGLAEHFKDLKVPTPDCPDNTDINFLQLNVSHITGQFGKAADAQQQGRFLKNIDIFVESTKELEILKLSDDVMINLQRLTFHWNYTKAKLGDVGVNQGDVVAYLALTKSKQGEKTAEMTVTFRREADKTNTFEGTWNAKPNDNLNRAGLCDRFLPASENIAPGHEDPKGYFSLTTVKGKLQTGKSLEISAQGYSKINIAIPGDQDVHLTEAGITLKATKATANASWAFSVIASGVLSSKHFQSVSEARAQISLGKGQDNYLCALVRKGQKVGNQDVAELMDNQSTSNEKWAALAPSETPISFDATASVVLYVDIKTEMLLMTGTAAGLGTATIFTNKSPTGTGRSYLVAVSVPNLSQAFPSLTKDMFSDFSLGEVNLAVLSYDGTLKSLSQVLDQPAKRIEDLKKLGMLPATSSQPPKPQTASNVLAAMIPLMSGYGDEDVHLEKGTFLSAEFNWRGSGSFKDDLLQYGSQGYNENPARIPRIFIYCHLKAKERTIKLLIRDYTLFGDSIIVNGCGSYHKEAGKRGEIKLQAKLIIRNLGDIDIETPKMTLEIKEKFTSYSLNGDGKPFITVANPLKDMFNAELSLSSITGKLEPARQGKRTHTATFEGSLRLGAKDSGVTIDKASVIVIDGKPQVVKVDFKTLEVGKIVKHILEDDDSGVSDDDLKLDEGQLYYAREETRQMVSDKLIVYDKGYHISATMHVCGEAFLGVMSLPSKDKKKTGAEFTASLKREIDFDFVKFINPGVRFNTKKTVGLTSQAEFFKETGFTVDLQREALLKKPVYRGKLKRGTDWDVSITYRDGCWGIEGWELPKIKGNKYKNLAKAIGDATQAEGKDPKWPKKCEDLVGLIFGELVQTTFNFHLKGPTAPKKYFEKGTNGGPGKINGRISWDYNINFLNREIKGLEMPPLDVTLTGPFTMKNLTEWLGAQIENNSVDMGRAILQRPQDLGEIIAVVCLDKLTPKLIAALVCRHIKDPEGKIPRKGYDKTDDDKKKGDDWLDKVGKICEKLTKLLAAAATVAGLIALYTSISAAAGELLEIVAAVKAGSDVMKAVQSALRLAKNLNKLKGPPPLVPPVGNPGGPPSTPSGGKPDGPPGHGGEGGEVPKPPSTGQPSHPVPVPPMDPTQDEPDREPELTKLESDLTAGNSKALEMIEEAQKKMKNFLTPVKGPKVQLIQPETDPDADKLKIQVDGCFPGLDKDQASSQPPTCEIRLVTVSSTSEKKDETEGEKFSFVMKKDATVFVDMKTAEINAADHVELWTRAVITTPHGSMEGDWFKSEFRFGKKFDKPVDVRVEGNPPRDAPYWNFFFSVYFKATEAGSHEVCVIPAGQHNLDVVLHRQVVYADPTGFCEIKVLDLGGINATYDKLSIAVYHVGSDTRLRRSQLTICDTVIPVLRGSPIQDVKVTQEDDSTFNMKWKQGISAIEYDDKPKQADFEMVFEDFNGSVLSVNWLDLERSADVRKVRFSLPAETFGGEDPFSLTVHFRTLPLPGEKLDDTGLYLFQTFKQRFKTIESLIIGVDSYFDPISYYAYLSFHSPVKLGSEGDHELYIQIVDASGAKTEAQHTDSLSSDGMTGQAEVYLGFEIHADSSRSLLVSARPKSHDPSTKYPQSILWPFPSEKDIQASFDGLQAPEVRFGWSFRGLEIMVSNFPGSKYPGPLFFAIIPKDQQDSARVLPAINHDRGEYYIETHNLESFMPLQIQIGNGKSKRPFNLMGPRRVYTIDTRPISNMFGNVECGAWSKSPARLTSLACFAHHEITNDANLYTMVAEDATFQDIGLCCFDLSSFGSETTVLRVPGRTSPTDGKVIGTRVAGVSRNVNHREIFWILPTGGIQCNWWSDGHSEGSYWKEDATAPFHEQLAYSGKGGSITASGSGLPEVGTEAESSHVWALSPDMTIIYTEFRLDGKGWRKPRVLESVGSTYSDDTIISPLASLIAPNGIPEVYWVNQKRQLVGMSMACRASGRDVLFQVIERENAVAPTAGLAVYLANSAEDGQAFYIFFITPDGAVKGARRGLRPNSTTGSWKEVEVAPPHSAHLSSEITVVRGLSGSFMVIWFDQDGTGRAAVPSQQIDRAKTADSVKWITLGPIHGLQSRLPDPALGDRMLLAAGPAESHSCKLAWVHQDTGKVANMVVLSPQNSVQHEEGFDNV